MPMTLAGLLMSTALAFSVAAPAADGFLVFDLPYKGTYAGFHAEDLDNDGYCEIVLLETATGEGGEPVRRLRIFWQDSLGFRADDQFLLSVPEELIVFDFGDVDGDLKKEFVFFAREGIAFHRLTSRKYAGDAQELISAETLYKVSNANALHRLDFVRDLTGDGRDDVLIPDFLKSTIRIREDGGGAAWQDVVLPLSSSQSVSAHFNRHFSIGQQIGAAFSPPILLRSDTNGDGVHDLVAVYPDSLVSFAGADGSYDPDHKHVTPIEFGQLWPGKKIQRSRLDDAPVRRFLMRLVDLNADGMLDAVSLRVSTEESLLNPETEIYVHFGRADAGGRLTFAGTPDQTIKPDGSVLVLRVLDTNRDSRQDLLAVTLRVSLPKLLKMLVSRTLDVQAGHYLLGQDGAYSEKPDSQDKLSVRFSFRGGAYSPVYEVEDFNGDGWFDMLTSRDESQLLIYPGRPDGSIGGGADVKYRTVLPQDGTRVLAMDLNSDKQCDVIVTYGDEDRERKKLGKFVRILMVSPPSVRD